MAAALVPIWDVSNSTLENQDFSGMRKLTVLCAVVQLLPLMFIKLMPGSNEEQIALQKNTETSVIKVLYYNITLKQTYR